MELASGEDTEATTVGHADDSRPSQATQRWHDEAVRRSESREETPQQSGCKMAEEERHTTPQATESTSRDLFYHGKRDKRRIIA